MFHVLVTAPVCYFRPEAGQQTRVMTRASLEEEWIIRVDALATAGTTVAASEAAMSGAILIR